MTVVINIADLVNPDTGKTYREENNARTHSFPLGSLVEVKDEGTRLFVVLHNRDCDGTPLYCLSYDRDATLEKKKYDTPPKSSEEIFLRGWTSGLQDGAIYKNIDEDSLELIRPPE